MKQRKRDIKRFCIRCAIYGRSIFFYLYFFRCAAAVDSLFFFFAFSRALIFQPIPVHRAWPKLHQIARKIVSFFDQTGCCCYKCYSNTYRPIFCTAISSATAAATGKNKSNDEMRLENSALARLNTSGSLPTISILMSVVRIRQFILRCPSLYLSANVCHYGFT